MHRDGNEAMPTSWTGLSTYRQPVATLRAIEYLLNGHTAILAGERLYAVSLQKIKLAFNLLYNPISNGEFRASCDLHSPSIDYCRLLHPRTDPARRTTKAANAKCTCTLQACPITQRTPLGAITSLHLARPVQAGTQQQTCRHIMRYNKAQRHHRLGKDQHAAWRNGWRILLIRVKRPQLDSFRRSG